MRDLGDRADAAVGGDQQRARRASAARRPSRATARSPRRGSASAAAPRAPSSPQRADAARRSSRRRRRRSRRARRSRPCCDVAQNRRPPPRCPRTRGVVGLGGLEEPARGRRLAQARGAQDRASVWLSRAADGERIGPAQYGDTDAASQREPWPIGHSADAQDAAAGRIRRSTALPGLRGPSARRAGREPATRARPMIAPGIASSAVASLASSISPPASDQADHDRARRSRRRTRPRSRPRSGRARTPRSARSAMPIMTQTSRFISGSSRACVRLCWRGALLLLALGALGPQRLALGVGSPSVRRPTGGRLLVAPRGAVAVAPSPTGSSSSDRVVLGLLGRRRRRRSGSTGSAARRRAGLRAGRSRRGAALLRRAGRWSSGIGRHVAELLLDAPAALAVAGSRSFHSASTGARDEDRRVGAGRDTDQQREREVLQRLAAEHQQRGDRDQRAELGGQRPGQHLAHRAVDDLRERRPRHARRVLPYSVEHDHRVVEREPEDRQQRRDRRRRHLPVGERVDARRDQQVVEQRDQDRDRELRLEPERDVAHDQQQRRDDRDRGAARDGVAERRPDALAREARRARRRTSRRAAAPRAAPRPAPARRCGSG